MRVRFTLPILLLAAASPVAAQSSGPVYHGAGFDVVLPAQYKPAETTSQATRDYRIQMSMFADDESALVVGRFISVAIRDTSLASRRALLQLTRAGMLQAAGENVAMEGDPRDFERDDRLGIRVPVRIQGEHEAVHGVTEMSVAREGGLELWLVMYMDKRSGKGVSTGERVLDSFRITGAPPEEAAFQGRGSQEMTDPKAKPQP
jgi:hypothetical protein